MQAKSILISLIGLAVIASTGFGQPVKEAASQLDLQLREVESIESGSAAAENIAAENIAAEPLVAAETLSLADVVASVYTSFPIIEQARIAASAARGMQTEAIGSYDTKLKAYTLSEPTGFYRNYRQGLGVARQTWWGGYVSAGYRLGRGDFQPWYKERETNEGGELRVAMTVPLLEGRAIDAERVAVFQANLAQRSVAPEVQSFILMVSLDAANAYWEWVAMGGQLIAQNELLDLAKVRQKQFEFGEEAGKFAEIDVVFNRQLVAERQSKLLETQQKFRDSAFKLSLFLRDAAGQPMVALDSWRPGRFPRIESFPVMDFQADLSAAMGRRPEMALLNLERQRLRLEQRLASNQLLPSVDLLSEASQDTGIPASSINDKGQFQLLVGLQSEFPLQRRKARGKFTQTSAKLAQLQQKLRFQQDKIGIELQTAHNALRTAEQLVVQADLALRAAVDSLGRYRYAYNRGYADLIYLNLLETKVNEAEIKLIDAQRSWFIALAEMQAALGLDPLEQAVNVAAMPKSNRPGPGHLPAAGPTDPDMLEQDWQKHSEPQPVQP